MQPRMHSRSHSNCHTSTVAASPSLWVVNSQSRAYTSRTWVARAYCMSRQQPVAAAAAAGPLDSPLAPQPLRWWSQLVQGLTWGYRPKPQATPAADPLAGWPQGLLSRLYSRVVKASAAERVYADIVQTSSSSDTGAAPRHLIVMVNGLFGSACECRFDYGSSGVCTASALDTISLPHCVICYVSAYPSG